MKISMVTILLTWFMGSPLTAQNSPTDALKLLDQVTAKYRDSDYLHLEATKQTVNHSARKDSSETSSFSLYLASGGRFRYAGEDYVGSSVLVSNGTDEWHVMNSFADYAKEPSGTFFTSRVLYAGDNSSLFGARDMLSSLRSMGTRLREAHFAAPETLPLNDRPVLCTVLEFSDKDSAPQQGPPYSWQMRVWLDPASLSVVKTERHVLTHLLFGNTPPPHAPPQESTTTTTFSVVDFDFKPTAETFAFVAPDGIHEVASLPTGLINPLPSGPDPRQEAATKHLGQMLPDVAVLDNDSKETSLTRYRGHPLLIDVWATWCEPCLSEMPALNRIRKATSGSDLQIIGVDEDLHHEDARSLLERRKYDWKDYGYTVPFARALSTDAIPLVVLVDSSGKIVYYHIGAGAVKQLTSAISSLGHDYQVTQ